MNQRKWELHILKGVNVSNHGAERMFEDSSDLLLFFFFFCFLLCACFLQGQDYMFLRGIQPSAHLYLPPRPPRRAIPPTRVMCAVGAAALDPVTHGQVGLRPVTAVIVSRPLIFPACLSYYRPPCGSLGGGEGGFRHAEVCLFVRLLSRGHPAACLLGGQLSPPTEDVWVER